MARGESGDRDEQAPRRAEQQREACDEQHVIEARDEVLGAKLEITREDCACALAWRDRERGRTRGEDRANLAPIGERDAQDRVGAAVRDARDRDFAADERARAREPPLDHDCLALDARAGLARSGARQRGFEPCAAWHHRGKLPEHRDRAVTELAQLQIRGREVMGGGRRGCRREQREEKSGDVP